MSHRYLTHFGTILFVHVSLLFCGLTLLKNESVSKDIGLRMLNFKVASEVFLGGGPKVEPKKATRSKSVSKIPSTKALPVEETSEESGPANDGKPGSLPGTGVGNLSGTATADLKTIFKAELRARIDENKFYPVAARRMGHSGTVVVAFTMLQDGTLTNIKIDSSSGNSQLDTAGLEAVKKVGKFKPIPSEFGTSSMDLSVPIKFQTL